MLSSAALLIFVILLFVGLPFGPIVGLARLAINKERKRAQRIDTVCREKNWGVARAAGSDKAVRFSWDEPETLGDVSRSWLETLEIPEMDNMIVSGRAVGAIHEVIAGEIEGVTFRAFTYTARTGRGSKTSVYGVTIIPSSIEGPVVSLRPETGDIMSRVVYSAVGSDIDFEDEEFNRRYRVTCRDPQRAYEAISQRSMEIILSTDIEKLYWTACALVKIDSRPIDIDRLEHHVRELIAIEQGR